MKTSSCQTSLLSSGDATIAWIAEHRESWLTPIMASISDLGSLGVIITIMSLAYWCWNKQASRTIWYGIFLSLLVNIWLKGLIMECRPPRIFHLENIPGTSYSFPSGHAQVTILMWCGLAYYVRSKWLAVFFILIGLLIAFSRPYLGVHYVHDVAVGLLLGLLILWLCILNEKKDFLKLSRFPLWGQTLLALSFVLICQLVINNQTGHLAIACAGLFGFWLGSKLEEKYLKFCATIQWPQAILIAVVGFGGILVLLYLPFPPTVYAGYLKYGLLGFWVAYGAPMVAPMLNKSLHLVKF